MTGQPHRRDFMHRTGTSLVGLGGLTALARFSPASAAAARLTPEDVRLSPDIEPLVRLIEDTPREKLVAAMIEQLHRGVTYRQFLASLFLASTRMAVSPHHFYMIHSAHQLSLNVGQEERLLPLFWALDTLNINRAKGKTRFPKMNLALSPSPEKAAVEFDAAMTKFDPERAEVALLALARSEGPRRAMSRLWHYAGRDHGDIGHPAIGLVNGWRTLETVGWRHAEAVCQYAARMPNWAKTPSKLYRRNVERATKGVKAAPPGWAGQRADEKAALELFAILRKGDSDGACRWTDETLTAGKVQAGTVWDAIFLAASDFLVRYADASGIGARPVHLNTTQNALFYAFQTCEDPQTRFYLVLQAVERAAEFIAVEQKRGKLRDRSILDLPAVDLPKSPEQAVEAIFSKIPTKRKPGGGTYDMAYGKREDYDEASHLTFALARAHPDHGLFLRTARRFVCLKATADTHNVKFPAAMFETYEHISPRWRPHLLAACVHADLHGAAMEDNPAVQQAREALRKL